MKQHERRIFREKCVMGVLGFILAMFALGAASRALAKIAALEKKLKEKGILDKEIKPA